MSEPNQFNEEYYERGQEKRISGYTNYGWMPERSFPEAVSIINHLGLGPFSTVVDFGCAKGYLVYALRRLGIDAFGEDISEYAIANAHPEVKPFVTNNVGLLGSWIIAKDVMEHIPEEQIPATLKDIRSRCDKGALFVIPLGDDNKFRIREYEIDVTHVTRKDEGWWVQKILEAGFSNVRVSYTMGDVKKKWIGPYPYGNGFFIATV
jgi:SAM-dependent methyltransferase